MFICIQLIYHLYSNCPHFEFHDRTCQQTIRSHYHHVPLHLLRQGRLQPPSLRLRRHPLESQISPSKSQNLVPHDLQHICWPGLDHLLGHHLEQFPVKAIGTAAIQFDDECWDFCGKGCDGDNPIFEGRRLLRSIDRIAIKYKINREWSIGGGGLLSLIWN